MAIPGGSDREQDTNIVDEEIRRVMPFVVDRIHYAEQRRNSYASFAAASVGAGTAILSAAAFTDTPISKLQIFVLVIAACLIIWGLLILYTFVMQINYYPWTSATNTWKWFYRDALPNNDALSPTFFGTIFHAAAQKTRIKREYANQLPAFVNRFQRELADSSTNLGQDLQQLYVLHVNEKYKNHHLTQLRNVTKVGILVIVAVLILSFILLSIPSIYECIHAFLSTQPQSP